MAELVGLLTRWHRLRKLGLVPPILQDGDQMWTFTNSSDPWGSREVLTPIMLERMVMEADKQPPLPWARCPVQSDYYCGAAFCDDPACTIHGLHGEMRERTA